MQNFKLSYVQYIRTIKVNIGLTSDPSESFVQHHLSLIMPHILRCCCGLAEPPQGHTSTNIEMVEASVKERTRVWTTRWFYLFKTRKRDLHRIQSLLSFRTVCTGLYTYSNLFVLPPELYSSWEKPILDKFSTFTMIDTVPAVFFAPVPIVQCVL